MVATTMGIMPNLNKRIDQAALEDPAQHDHGQHRRHAQS